MLSYKARLKRLEAHSNEGYSDVLSWIKAGRYYDELSETEKERYCLYCGSDRIGLEQLEGYFNGLHFQLERKSDPPTPNELAQRIQSVEQWVEDVKKETS